MKDSVDNNVIPEDFKTITYWIANTVPLFGSFRTVASTETKEEFDAYCKEYGFERDEDGYFRVKEGKYKGATINVEKIKV